MAKKAKSKESSGEKPQKFDESFKKWISHDVEGILPLLVTGVQYERELSVEFSRSMMRADKVFQVRYHGKPYILNVEFQVSADDKLTSRLLLYNAALYHKYQLPVMSMVIYPFAVRMAVSPLVIPNNEKDILIFHFETMSLFERDAGPYVQNHHTCMYPILPTMLGFHADMAVQAVSELSERYRDDANTLGEHFVCMQLCLERNSVIELAEKINIAERLLMFDKLWDESPTIQKMREDYRMKGRQEGLQEGRQEGRQEGLQALQHLLVDVVQKKYPDLGDLAQQQASHFDKPDALGLLIQQVLSAHDVDTVYRLLQTMPM